MTTLLQLGVYKASYYAKLRQIKLIVVLFSSITNAKVLTLLVQKNPRKFNFTMKVRTAQMESESDSTQIASRDHY